MGSSKNRHLYIANANGSSHGLMRCASCNKPIPLNDKGFAAEDYAYYETSEAYVTFHRGCSADNPAWAKHDAERQKQARIADEFKADCLAFYRKWNTTDFTDELEGLI